VSRPSNSSSLATTDGWARASRQIGQAARKSEDLAVILIYMHSVQRSCATVGHQRTVELLEDIYLKILEMAGDNGAVERLSDRKFAMLLRGFRNRGHVSLAALKLQRIIGTTTIAEPDGPGLSATIGVVMCPEHGSDPHELLRLAEVAVLDGQRRGAATCFYETESAEQMLLDWDLEQRLADGIEAGDLELHYQPKVCLRTGRIVGAEALMRWREPELGPISPEVFIALAESTGQIVELTHFAIQRACRQLSEWRSSAPALSVAVNVTPTIIQNSEIVDTIESSTSIWGVAPEFLTVEVTENSLMANQAASHRVLTRIRELGARVSIDDFGTGYSSLSYLKDIPADELKIDRSFVMGMLSDAGDRKIVEHTIGLAKSFGLSVVAEGIESAEILEELRRLGCDLAQGYFICKPLPAAEFGAFLVATGKTA